ncbi:hypothetical protein [Kribbella speibonae]|uniref:Uncharacterized protein n=1 Tax=Kribbella speibonae TaxID=1572660 RepID=A0A4R0IE33_9ACTN|nr:hypothetical protein [Kribbella speibonae]TCC29068.1 hypothetical protein E0H92_43625 [Kribbella speibonae]
MARAVVEPDLAKGLLEAPTRYRIPGAELLVIRIDVYTSRVIADATNPRTLNDIVFPAAVAPGADQTSRYRPLEPPTSNAYDFTINVSSFGQLIWQLDAVMAATIKENTPRPPIIEQGVMEPPLAVPACIAEPGDKVVGGAVLIREGSTRVSHAQSILGLTAAALLRQYVDDRTQRQLIDELNTIAHSSASSISEHDAGRIRVATMPVDLVVGVEPDAEAEVTLGEAVAAKVAQDHLNHKKEWKAAAKEVHLGEQCLIALHEESLLTDEQKSWLAGRLSSTETVDGEMMTEDDRWAELLWLFATRSRPQAAVVRRPIATVLEREAGRRRVSNRADRIPLAVALAMRARRGAVTDTAVERESKILESAVPSIVWEVAWKPTKKPVKDLAEDAIEAAASRTRNKAAAELAARAVWYLARHGQLSMPRNDLGAGGDRRLPSELVAGMLASPRGVRQLARAILDGRDGGLAGLVLDDAGTVDVSGVGTPVQLRDDMVRSQIVPRSGPPAPPPRNPREEFMDAIAALGQALNSVRAADEDLRKVENGHGSPMFQVEGVAEPYVEDFKRIIDEVQNHLGEYVVNWRVVGQLRQQSSGE